MFLHMRQLVQGCDPAGDALVERLLLYEIAEGPLTVRRRALRQSGCPRRFCARLSAPSASHSRAVVRGGFVRARQPLNGRCRAGAPGALDGAPPGRAQLEQFRSSVVVAAGERENLLSGKSPFSFMFSRVPPLPTQPPNWKEGSTSGSAASSLSTTAHPLHTRLAKILGASVSEATMRPNPRSIWKELEDAGNAQTPRSRRDAAKEKAKARQIRQEQGHARPWAVESSRRRSVYFICDPLHTRFYYNIFGAAFSEMALRLGPQA